MFLIAMRRAGSSTAITIYRNDKPRNGPGLTWSNHQPEAAPHDKCEVDFVRWCFGNNGEWVITITPWSER